MMRIKRNNFMNFWDKFGIILPCTGVLLSIIVYGINGYLHWCLASILIILFVLSGIGWAIDIFAHYVDEVENGFPPARHFHGSYHSTVAFGSFCFAIAIAFIGYKSYPDTLLFICLPFIPVSAGITIGAFASARIYLIRKGYHINKVLTVAMAICSTILILPLLIPLFYITIMIFKN